MTTKKIVRKAAPKHEPSTVAEPLSPGDSIEYSISVEVRGPNGTAWVKAGTISAVRADESTEDAKRRVVEFVEGTVVAKAAAIAKGEV